MEAGGKEEKKEKDERRDGGGDRKKTEGMKMQAKEVRYLMDVNISP